MTKESLPKSFEKRKLLHGQNTDFDFYAQMYIDNYRFSDALDFLEKTKNKELLQIIKQKAVEIGDFQILSQIKKISSDIVEDVNFKDCEEKARQLGKNLFADKCAKKSES